MLDGGSVTGMIDDYARLWQSSSTIFYYPHCLMLEAIVRRLMILYSQVLPRIVTGGESPGQTGQERECPTRLGKTRRKCISHDISLQDTHSTALMGSWSREN